MPPTKRKQPRKKTPAPQNGHSKYEPTQWGRPKQGDLVCPSGQICLVKPLSIVGLVEQGVLTNVDELTALVSERVIDPIKRGKPIKDLTAEDVNIDELTKDPKSIDRIMDVVDKTLIAAVIQPPLHLPPKKMDKDGKLELDADGNPQDDDDAREEGRVYTDTIEVTDKMFIFQFVLGGTRMWADFRDSAAKLVGDLRSVEAVGSASESDAKSR